MPDTTYVWDPTWSVGNPVLDDQHKILFDICRRIHQLRESGDDITSERYAEFVDEAIRFARTHFHTEEHMMRKCQYPDLEAHIQEHRQFMDYLSHVHTKSEQRSVGIDEFASSLRKWLVDHIRGSDMCYKAYFK